MQSSKLGCQAWAIAMYLVVTSLKGISSMKLHRELDVTQKSAWLLAHRIRQAWATDLSEVFAGPAEVGEACLGPDPQRGRAVEVDPTSESSALE